MKLPRMNGWPKFGLSGLAHPRKLCLRGITVFLAVLLLFSGACAPGGDYAQQGSPVEPLVAGQDEPSPEGELVVRGRFAVINPEMTVYALDISNDGRRILFSADTSIVSMIDDQGRLQWEISLENDPISAALSRDGRFAAVGTDAGDLLFLRPDGREQWRTTVDGTIKKLALAPGGESLAVSMKDEDGRHVLTFFHAWGDKLYELETAVVKEIVFLSRGDFAYLEQQEAKTMLFVYKDGQPRWEEEVSLAAFSANGRYMAAVSNGELQFKDLTGDSSPQVLWSKKLELEPSWMRLTEMGGHVIVYSGFSGSESNLFVYDRSGNLAWDKRIPSGSLVEASRFGERIVATSWQEYSEDFSKLLVLDIQGHTLQSVEMASRIEKLALSGDGKVLSLASSDGDIFIFELPVQGSYPLETAAYDENNGVFYKPVARERPEGETYVTLYFYDQNAMHLIPVNRPIKNIDSLLKMAIDELIKGPRRGSSLSRTIPKDAAIEVAREESLVYIDLPEDLNRIYGSVQATGIINSLVYTASQFSYVRGIQFLIEGEKANYFGTEGLLIDELISPQRPGLDQEVIYVPYRSADRYYLLPRESLKLGERSSLPQELVHAILKESERFLPVSPRLIDAKVFPGEIILDWDASFQELFPPEGDPEEKALAHLFIDSLVLTLTSRFAPGKLVFKVEGKLWSPPEGYPSLEQELSSPYFINPE